MHKALLSGRKDKADAFPTEIKIINNDWNKIPKTTHSGSCFPYLLLFKVCDLRSKTKTFIVAFATQLRSVAVSCSCLSVLPAFRVENFYCHGTDFCVILYLRFLRKLVHTLRCCWEWDKNYMCFTRRITVAISSHNLFSELRQYCLYDTCWAQRISFSITETDCGFYEAEETLQYRASSLVGFKCRASTFKRCLF